MTSYSGNTDFTRADNSLLVDYRMAPVGPDCAPYEPFSQWADPDVEQAACHLRTIATNAELRARLSHAGQTFVRENLGAAAVGHAMSKRLKHLHDRRGQAFEGVQKHPFQRPAFERFEA